MPLKAGRLQKHQGYWIVLIRGKSSDFVNFRYVLLFCPHDQIHILVHRLQVDTAVLASLTFSFVDSQNERMLRPFHIIPLTVKFIQYFQYRNIFFSLLADPLLWNLPHLCVQGEHLNFPGPKYVLLCQSQQEKKTYRIQLT